MQVLQASTVQHAETNNKAYCWEVRVLYLSMRWQKSPGAPKSIISTSRSWPQALALLQAIKTFLHGDLQGGGPHAKQQRQGDLPAEYKYGSHENTNTKQQ